jgi:hypothetical protein
MKRQRVGSQFWLFVFLLASFALAYPVTSTISEPSNSTDIISTNHTIPDTALVAVPKPAPTSSGPITLRSRSKRRLGHVDVGPFWGYGVELESYQVLEDTKADAGSNSWSASGNEGAKSSRKRISMSSFFQVRHNA